MIIIIILLLNISWKLTHNFMNISYRTHKHIRIYFMDSFMNTS